MSATQKVFTSSTLEGMTIKDLVKHALEEFDVAIDPGTMKKQKICGYILALQDLREGGVSVDAGDKVDGTAPEPIAEEDIDAEITEVVRQAQETRVKIIFHSTPEPGGNLEIKMGLNGRAYKAKRDVEVLLPESVFKACIQDAVQTLYEPKTDPVTRITTVSEPRDVQRFSYTILGTIPGSKAA